MPVPWRKRPIRNNRLLLALLSGLIGVPAGAAAPAEGTGPPAGAKAKQDMNAPMTTEMMKPGMKKGDVGKAAKRRATKLQPMLDKEQGTMPARATDVRRP